MWQPWVWWTKWFLSVRSYPKSEVVDLTWIGWLNTKHYKMTTPWRKKRPFSTSPSCLWIKCNGTTTSGFWSCPTIGHTAALTSGWKTTFRSPSANPNKSHGSKTSSSTLLLDKPLREILLPWTIGGKTNQKKLKQQSIEWQFVQEYLLRKSNLDTMRTSSRSSRLHWLWHLDQVLYWREPKYDLVGPTRPSLVFFRLAMFALGPVAPYSHWGLKKEFCHLGISCSAFTS